MFSGPANRYVRSLVSQARQGGIDRKAARRAARTSAMKTEVRAAAEPLARLSDRPLCKKWTGPQSVPCDKQLGIPLDVPFPGLGSATEMMRPAGISPISVSCDKKLRVPQNAPWHRSSLVFGPATK